MFIARTQTLNDFERSEIDVASLELKMDTSGEL